VKLNAVQTARYLAASEHSFLVSRGVRAIAACGMCEGTPDVMLETYKMLEEAAHSQEAHAFVFQVGEWASYGYYSELWALRLYQWLFDQGSAIPEEHSDAIYGMLYGYHTSVINKKYPSNKATSPGAESR